MKKAEPHFSTRVVQAGRNPQQQAGFVNPPVYRGSTVIYPTLAELEDWHHHHGERNRIGYGRFGSPTTLALENAMAELEGGYGAIVVSSGLAAVTTALLAYLNAGDHALVADTVYGPTRKFCQEFLIHRGIEVTFYDPLVGGDIETLIKTNTRCIFLESPGSQTFEVQDIPAISEVAGRRNIATIMDNTWATPCFFRPLDHGINVSIQAGTKYIVGHADAMIGILVMDEAHDTPVRECRNLLGHHAGPDDIYLTLRGLRTLEVRMQQHQQQGLALANWLQDHPDVLRVLHPALEACPGHETWKRDFSGSSGLFSFEIETRSRPALADFLDNMAVFSMGASWGGFESLILPMTPASSRTAREWQSPHTLIRVHAGLENIDDLRQDLDAGLARYRKHL